MKAAKYIELYSVQKCDFCNSNDYIKIVDALDEYEHLIYKFKHIPVCEECLNKLYISHDKIIIHDIYLPVQAEQDWYKLLKTVKSCKTKEHFIFAIKYINLFCKKHRIEYQNNIIKNYLIDLNI